MNRLHTIISAAILVPVLSLFCSCESENALTVINQEAQIESFINNKYPDNEVIHNGGSNRIVLVAGDSLTRVAYGDSVHLEIDGFIFNSGPGVQFLSDERTLCVDSKNLVEGLEKGLEGAALGEESYIVFSAEYGYYKASVGVVPPMSALIYRTLIREIKKN